MGWDLVRCNSSVYADNDSLNLDQREYVIVEWQECDKTPELDSLGELVKKNKSNGNSDRHADAQAAVELQQCFHMFTETDKLAETDAWYCNRCKEHREAYKKMEFWSMPPVLCVQLKRFAYGEWRRDRLDTDVRFPLENLDLSEYCVQRDGPMMYDLASVSIHMGGLGGGHYTAYARSSEDGKWYEYNDSSVRQVPRSTVAGDQSGA